MPEMIVLHGSTRPSTTSNRSAGTVDVHVGSRIRLRRAELGISQQDLAAQIGIAFQQIQKYEVGRNRVSARRLYEIAEALDVGIAYFFQGLDCRGDDHAVAAPSRPSLQRIVNDPTMMRFLTLLSRHGTPAVRERAAAIVMAMAGADGAATEAIRTLQ